MRKFYTSLCLILGLITGLTAQVNFELTRNENLSNNVYTVVDVNVSGFTDILSMQYGISWNPDIFTFESLDNLTADLPGLNLAGFNLPDPNGGDEGIIRASWISSNVVPQSLNDGTLLFSIKLQNSGPLCSNSDIQFTDAFPTLIEIIDKDFNELQLVSSPLNLQIPGPGCGGSTDCLSDVTVNPEPWNCSAELTPDLFLSNNNYDTANVTPDQLNAANIGNTIQVTVEYTLNGVTANCSSNVSFIDNVAPVVVVEQALTAKLDVVQGEDPSVRIYAEDIDEGSYDACSGITLSPEYYDFDCSHIGDQIIILEVEDDYGNINTAWTIITIEYKPDQLPVLQCPADIVVPCTTELDDPDNLENLLGQATVDLGCAPVYKDVFDFDQNNDGDINDSFNYLGETVLEKYNIGCNYGPIIRTWSVPGVNLNCQQIIIVKESEPFDGTTMVDWPYSQDAIISIADNDGSASCDGNAVQFLDLEIDPLTGIITGASVEISCEEDLCEMPAWDKENTCSLIGVSVETDRFESVDQHCLKIINNYTLIDWCVYDPFATPSPGIWTWVVTATLDDQEAPYIDVVDDQELACSEKYILSAIATDFTQDTAIGGSDFKCPSNQISWEVFLDIENDGIYDKEWSSFVEEDKNTPNDPLWSDDNLEKNLLVYGYSIPDVRVGSQWNIDNASSVTTPSGFPYEIFLDDDLTGDSNIQHRVLWKAHDGCGNISEISSMFSVNESLDTEIPVSKCISFLSASLDDPDGPGPEQASVTIWASDFIASAYDNCSDPNNLKFGFSDLAPSVDPDFPSNQNSSSLVFTETDLGMNDFTDILLDIYTWDEAENHTSCQVTLRLTPEENPCIVSNIQCSEVMTDLDGNGVGELKLSDVNVTYFNPCNVSGVQLSFDPTDPNLQSLALNCADKGLNQYKVFIMVNGLIVGNCQNTLKVNDPFGVCPDNTGTKVHFFLPEVTGNNGDQVCVPLKVNKFKDVDALQGSLSWDENVITYVNTQNHTLPGMGPLSFGLNGVDMGQLSFLWIDQTGSTPATLADGAVLFDICFDVIGEEGDFSFVQLSDAPTPVELVSNNIELEFTSSPGKVIVGQSNCGPGQDNEPPVPYCKSDLKAVLVDPDNTGPMEAQVEVWAIDFDGGSFDNCTDNKNLRFTFSSTHPDNDPEYNITGRSSSRIFTSGDIPAPNIKIPLEIYVWDKQDNTDFCQVKLELVDTNDDPCYNNTESNIQWPLPQIDLSETNVDLINTPGQFSPQNLINHYGFSESDVYPIFINTTCTDGLAVTYDDLVIPVNGVYFKIIRTFTVLDWYTANVYEFVQLIRNIDQSDMICDFLPNTAPVGDCISGHTLEDDVEWPADISIADHRIKPSELIAFSGIAQKDANPIFYNSDADKYLTEYIDVLHSLSTVDIVLDRQWTVTRSDNPTVSWKYTQKITVDITMFPNLVTINTIKDRPIPNVLINQNVVTDENGVAFVMNNEEVNPVLIDNPFNGLDIKDLILIQHHILGISVLDQLEILAADLNKDQIVSTIDIVELMKSLVGLSLASSEWDFLDYTNNTSLAAQLRGHYIGIKPGDVDDSAKLKPGNTEMEEEDLHFDDVLLNAGESYQIPFYIENIYDAWGMQFHLDFDPGKIQITNITSDVFENLIWNLTGAGQVSAVSVVSNGQSISVGEKNSSGPSIIAVEIEALDNSTLGESLELSTDNLSYMMLEDFSSIRFAGSLEGGIILHTHDLGDGKIAEVYPNPVVEFLNFKLPAEYQNSDLRIEILDLSGRKIIEEHNSLRVDLTDLTEGFYLYRIRIGDKMFSERFVKLN